MDGQLAFRCLGLLALTLVTSCSLINTPSDPEVGKGGGGGGSGGGGSTTTTATTGGGGTTSAPACSGDGDCTGEATECADSVCTDGACTPAPKAAGTSCGPAPTSTCDLPDTCDGAGTCAALVAPDGAFCSDCPAGAGKCAACKAGACGDCTGSRATEKSFRTPLSASGWQLTGGWAIYEQTPPSGAVPTVFSHRVLGTDGNRAHPYPGNEHEESTATSPPTVLSDTISFLSWNWDEGFQYDLKAVQVSADGTNWQSIAVCPQGGQPEFAFCNAWDPSLPRAADQWDTITLPTPAELIGKVGYVRFVQDTKDSCCGWEQGWYIDALNFAADCACADAAACGFLDGECATGTCAATGECHLAAKATGDMCTLGGALEATCSMPACDATGWCNSNYLQFEGGECSTCPDGTGDCKGCSAGTCPDCAAAQPFSAFDGIDWMFTGSWSLWDCLPPNSVTPMDYVCFPYPMSDPSEPLRAPFLGNIGSRTGEIPFIGGSKIESGLLTTGPTVFPAAITFNSWHQDRGGNDTFNLKDKKQIKISKDNGQSWTTIVSCEGNDTFPFCQPWPAFTDRAVDAWDAVSIPVPADFVGEKGIVQFSYDTVDAGEGWERGWMFDDFNINRCDSYLP